MSKVCGMCDKPIAENRTYCSYKCSNNRPEHKKQSSEQITKYNKSSEHRLSASKIGKIYGPSALIRYNKSEKHRKYMREIGSKIGIENLTKFLRSPEGKKQSSERLTKYNKSTAHRIAASIQGLKNVESGQCFEALKKAREHKNIHHLNHIHARIAEYVECLKHHYFFPTGYVHALVKIGSREIDWVIADPKIFNQKDPSTWFYVIEYHPPFWKTNETFKQYKDDRTIILRYLGVSCPILVYHTKQQWAKLASLYNLQCVTTVLEGVTS